MIRECKCPKCGNEINNYWDFADKITDADSDSYFIDYNLHCKCGCKFRYTEWFILSSTEIEVL